MYHFQVRASLETVRNLVDPRNAVTSSGIIHSNDHTPLIYNQRDIPVKIKPHTLATSIESVTITESYHTEGMLDAVVWTKEMSVCDGWVEIFKIGIF